MDAAEFKLTNADKGMKPGSSASKSRWMSSPWWIEERGGEERMKIQTAGQAEREKDERRADSR